jgi:amidase
MFLTETETQEESVQKQPRLSRREFLYGASAAAALTGAGVLLGNVSLPSLETVKPRPIVQAASSIEEATIAQLQAGMSGGSLTAASIVNMYEARISTLDQSGPTLNSILQVNPDAVSIARRQDMLRQSGTILGAMQGIPVLLKDNIDTHDQLQTAAGSFALVGTPALQDSTVAANLRKAGAVILGKTNLSEWANFRSFHSSSGWSGRGGQCHNPYAIEWNPCGSSSGSGAATSGNLTSVSIGTETDGSIVCPANNNGVVGIKPTVGLVSRAGVVPISHTQDTVGPHARTVADAATVLNAIIQRTPDPRDPATSTVPLGQLGTGAKRPNLSKIDYTQFLNTNGLNGARIGVSREFEGFSPHADSIFEDSLTAMKNAGATLVDVFFPNFQDIFVGNAEITVLLFDFVTDIQKYLATRTGVPAAGGSIQTLIDFDNNNAASEMPFFGQELFELAASLSTDPNAQQGFGFSYNEALAHDQLIGATQGIDLLLSQNNLDAIVAPTDNPPWPTDLINGDHFVIGSSSPCAIVGYPIINVPSGFSFGVPVGISFMGTAFSEPKLIKLASGFEATTHARQKPQFLETLNLGANPSPTRGRAGKPKGIGKLIAHL